MVFDEEQWYKQGHHNSSLVISLNIDSFNVKRMLVDLGSLDNITHMRVFDQMELSIIVTPVTNTLARFNMFCTVLKGKVTLVINNEGQENSFVFDFLCPNLNLHPNPAHIYPPIVL